MQRLVLVSMAQAYTGIISLERDTFLFHKAFFLYTEVKSYSKAM